MTSKEEIEEIKKRVQEEEIESDPIIDKLVEELMAPKEESWVQKMIKDIEGKKGFVKW